MALALHDVEIRHLSALRAVAEEGTFARAADRLGYTQSAISQQISTLERLVGAALFERPGGPRPATLTAFGQRLLGHAATILDRLAAAESDLEQFVAGQVGSISVGTYQSISVRVLPEMLQLLRLHRPDLEVKLHEEVDERELLENLLNRRLDVTFLAQASDDPLVQVVPMFQDPYVVVSPRTGDPFDPARSTVQPEELATQPFIAEGATCTGVTIEQGLSRLGVVPRVVFRSQDNAAIQALVRSGMGIAVMPSLAVETNDPDVVIRLLEPAIPARQIGVAVLRNRALPPAVEHLVELALAVASRLVADTPLLAAPVAAGR